jgi:hypothetical protein
MKVNMTNAWIEDSASMSHGGFWVWGQHTDKGRLHMYRNVWEDGTPVSGFGGEWRVCPFCEVEPVA